MFYKIAVISFSLSMPLVSFASTDTSEISSPSEMEIIMEKASQVLEGIGCSKECTKPLTTENGVDLEAMIDRFSSLGKNNDDKKKETAELFILVSLSMPEQSLKLWSEQANKVGATLVLKGLVENSIKKTVERAEQLFGEIEKGGFSIDPERFQQFQVKAVPAVVITTPIKDIKGGKTETDSDFDIVYGDTSLEDALQTITVRGSLEAQKIAKEYLQLCRSKNHD